MMVLMRRLKKCLGIKSFMVKVMRSDGNGGYVIQKGAFALIMVVIALLSCVATVVAYGVSIKSDVDYLKSEYAEAGPRHVDTINDIGDRIEANQMTIIQNQERIISMQSDISEIKFDLKECLK